MREKKSLFSKGHGEKSLTVNLESEEQSELEKEKIRIKGST